MNIVIKPIVWNSIGYTGPCGPRSYSGFPSEHGYGGEEWNNSLENRYVEDGETFCVFHIEGSVGDVLTLSDRPDIMLMVASHGQQYLFGIAIGAEPVPILQRKKLIASLGLQNRWREIWDVSLVRRKYDDNQEEFEDHWKKTSPNSLNWKCAKNNYFWFERPVELDVTKVTGKNKFVTHYNRHQPIDLLALIRILEQVPKDSLKEEDQGRFRRFVDDIRAPDASWAEVERVIESLDARTPLTEALGKSIRRIGHDRWRDQVRRYWNYQCAVTGSSVLETLRAGHIVKWSIAEKSRLDPDNGLLLVGTLDLLFEKLLIAFDDKGTMLISQKIPDKEIQLLGLNTKMKLRMLPNEKQRKYLRQHRENFT